MSEKRPFFMFPVIGIAIVIAVVFFVVRKHVASVDVPTPVAATVDHFAPGIAIGGTVKEASTHLNDVRWVPHLGYVGSMRDAGSFVQARLYPDAATRGKPAGDVSARVQQVEYVSTSSMGMARMMSDLAIVFHNNNPREGCITSLSVDDPPQRRVQYWVTPNDKGGVALVSDWDTRVKTKPGPVVWSIIAWAGPFQGATQLHAGFETRSCFDSTAAGDPKTDDATDAVENFNVAFRDSISEQGASLRQAADAAAAPNATPMTAQACFDPGQRGPTQVQSTTLVSVELPDDFTPTNREQAEREAERTGYARYSWRGSDGSTVTLFPGSSASIHSGWTGGIDTECTLNIAGDSVHTDIANASVGLADFVVHGHFFLESGAPLVFMAHARSHERQEALLHALRTVSVNPRWGSRRPE